MKIHLLILFILYTVVGKCQVNLVPNPGFEEYYECPTLLDGINNNIAVAWGAPTDGSSDYFNSCSPPGAYTDVPNTIWGYRTPHGGNAFAGILMHSTQPAAYSANDYSEYLQTRLINTLEKDAFYCVTFYVSAPQTLSGIWQSFTTDAVALSFSKDEMYYHANAVNNSWKLAMPQHIKNPVGNFFMPSDGWVKVSGIYRALGNERFIVIGNFNPQGTTPLIALDSATNTSIGTGAYLFIDDVTVVKVDNKKDTLPCLPELSLTELDAPVSTSGFLWNTGETTPVINPADTGWYWVEYDAGCGLKRDSIHVSVLSAPAVSLPADTTICIGSVIQLQSVNTGGAASAYHWSNGATTSAVNIGDDGMYIIKAANRCGVSYDTINVSLLNKPIIQLPSVVDLCVDTQVLPLTITSGLPLANYTWSTGETTAQITLTEPGSYWLASENVCGTAYRYFDAKGCPPPPIAPLPFASIFIPNVFSPNGDGNNDVWSVYGDSIRVSSIMVFNRWGEKVFDTDSNQGWDGSYKGVPQSPGVYVYYIKCSDLLTAEPKHYKGSLTLLR